MNSVQDPEGTEVAFEPHSTGEAIFGTVWFLVYIFARLFLGHWFDSVHEFAGLAFDLGYSILGIIFFSSGKFRLGFSGGKISAALIATSLLLGTLTFKMASWMGLSIPFDHLEFGNPEHHVIIALLLLVGPIIEELVYRQALWFSLETMTDRWPRVVAWAPLFVTALLFSIGHFESYSTVPPEYKSFVLFQTGYTLALGLWWGRIYQVRRSLGLMILLHMGYNFGFWLGSVV